MVACVNQPSLIFSINLNNCRTISDNNEMKLTVFQTLIVRVQHEVLEATGDVVIGQELQVILIKLKLQRMLLQNLQGYKKTERDS